MDWRLLPKDWFKPTDDRIVTGTLSRPTSDRFYLVICSTGNKDPNNRHAIPNSVILVTAISVSVLALESSPINIVSPIVQPCNAFKAGSNICGDKS